jgi:hypothetical protein
MTDEEHVAPAAPPGVFIPPTLPSCSFIPPCAYLRLFVAAAAVGVGIGIGTPTVSIAPTPTVFPSLLLLPLCVHAPSGGLLWNSTCKIPVKTRLVFHRCNLYLPLHLSLKIPAKKNNC